MRPSPTGSTSAPRTSTRGWPPPVPFPRTSQPTPAEFEDVFRELGADGAPIICTTISADLSGTYASATQARAALPELDIRVIDTRSVAVGHYAAVREAVRVIESGGDADSVVAGIAAVGSTDKVLFTVETLEFLRRGGRIGGARALLGSVLDIKPILEIRDGVIEAVGRVRTYPRAIDRVVEECRQAAEAWGGAELVVAHANRPKIAAELVERMRPLVSGEPALTVVGPVVGCHSGPGAIGVGFHKPIA